MLFNSLPFLHLCSSGNVHGLLAAAYAISALRLARVHGLRLPFLLEPKSSPAPTGHSWREGISRIIAGRYAIRRSNIELVAGRSSRVDHLHTVVIGWVLSSIGEFLDGLRAAHGYVLLEST